MSSRPVQKQMDFLSRVSLVSVKTDDWRHTSDTWRHLHDLILRHEPMYPEIGQWLGQRVGPELDSGKRLATLAYVNNKPVVASIVKPGAMTKICHLSATPEVQNSGLGQLLFALTAVQVRNVAREVYFTLPESLWEEKNNFFTSFGFDFKENLQYLYRPGAKELLCKTSSSTFWQNAKSRLNTLVHSLHGLETCLDSRGVLSVRPAYAERILNGKKTVEIRKHFPVEWTNQRVCLYATRKVGGLVGTVRVVDVVRQPPHDIWEMFGDDIGCSRAEFDSYVGDASQVSAVVLDDVRPLGTPLSRKLLRDSWGIAVTPPQSYCAIRQGSEWLLALAVAGAGEAAEWSSKMV
jgi:predicted transcriptional regulator